MVVVVVVVVLLLLPSLVLRHVLSFFFAACVNVFAAIFTIALFLTAIFQYEALHFLLLLRLILLFTFSQSYCS